MLTKTFNFVTVHAILCIKLTKFVTMKYIHFKSPDILYICYFNDSKKICIPNIVTKLHVNG